MSRLICLLLLFFFTQSTLNAQTSVYSPSGKSKKAIPLKLTARFGGYKDSAILSTDELKTLISSPLIVTDDKGATLSISNFQVAYKRQIITEDEATGKKLPSTQLVTALFTTPTLSSIWIKTIKRELVPREELLFFDIVAKDKKGLAHYAPEIKIITK